MFGVFAAGGAWEVRHGILFMGAGLLMLVFRPAARLPRAWWIMAGVFVLLGCGAFLPVAWFGVPEWRRQLGALGLDTGGLQVVQVRLAVEMLGVFVITLVVGMWMAGQRVPSRHLGRYVLLFALGVAAYAVISRLLLAGPEGRATYGLFPNRNHTATLLAMGSMCGLASFFQAIRDRKWGHLVGAVVTTGICFWAVLGWSESRAGLLLVALGAVAFFLCMGRRYLGKHSLRALVLLAALVVGGFLIADSALKARLVKTTEKARSGELESKDASGSEWEERAGIDQLSEVDFRVPVWRDGLDLAPVSFRRFSPNSAIIRLSETVRTACTRRATGCGWPRSLGCLRRSLWPRW